MPELFAVKITSKAEFSGPPSNFEERTFSHGVMPGRVVERSLMRKEQRGASPAPEVGIS